MLQTGIFAELIASERTALALEKRSSLENPQTPLSYPAEWLLDIFNGSRTDSGIRVSELTAFQVSTFLAGADLISGKISSLPVHVYERSFSTNGRAIHRVAYEHDYYELIHGEPNDEMSRQTFLKAFLCHCLAWGNGYAEIQRDAGNRAVALWPRNPWKTRPIRLESVVHLEPVAWRPFPVSLAAGTMAYRTTDGIEEQAADDGRKASQARIIPLADMVHVPGLAFDGRLGQSVVWLARQTLGLALATEKFGAKYFANFARPGGMLMMPVNLGKEEKEQAKRSWQEAQGGENSNRIAVMPPGFDFKEMSHRPVDAQSVEMRAYIRNDIAALLHVPPRMLGDQSKSSRASTEQENQELLDYTLSPWISAIKLELKRKLFPHPGVGRVPKNKFFVDFDVSELIRGDAQSREKFYASGKQWGYLNTNDIRGMEKLNPIEEAWAEDYWMPVNMTLVHTPIDPTHQDGAGHGDAPPKPSAEDDVLARAYSRIFRDAFGRILHRSERDLATFSRCFGPILFSLRDLFAAAAAREMRMAWQPAVESEQLIARHLGEMYARAADWSEVAIEERVKEELVRAIQFVRLAVYTEAAAVKAKEPILIQ